MMPRWGEVGFSKQNIAVYNLRLISYMPDKLVAILLYWFLNAKSSEFLLSSLAGNFHPKHGLKQLFFIMLHYKIQTLKFKTVAVVIAATLLGQEIKFHSVWCYFYFIIWSQKRCQYADEGQMGWWGPSNQLVVTVQFNKDLHTERKRGDLHKKRTITVLVLNWDAAPPQGIICIFHIGCSKILQSQL